MIQVLNRTASILRALTFLASACARLGAKQRAFSFTNVGLSVPSPFSVRHPAFGVVASLHLTASASLLPGVTGVLRLGGENAVAPFC